MINPDQLEETVEKVTHEVEDQARTGLESKRLLGSQGALDSTLAHQIMGQPTSLLVGENDHPLSAARGYHPRREDAAWFLKIEHNRAKIKHSPEERQQDADVRAWMGNPSGLHLKTN